MTPVHVNRMLSQMKAEGLIDLVNNKTLTVLDFEPIEGRRAI
jgi:hypothetical protein